MPPIPDTVHQLLTSSRVSPCDSAESLIVAADARGVGLDFTSTPSPSTSSTPQSRIETPERCLYVDIQGDLAVRNGDRYGYVQTRSGRVRNTGLGSWPPPLAWAPDRVLQLLSAEAIARILRGEGELGPNGWRVAPPAPATPTVPATRTPGRSVAAGDVVAWADVPSGSVVEDSEAAIFMRWVTPVTLVDSWTPYDGRRIFRGDARDIPQGDVLPLWEWRTWGRSTFINPQVTILATGLTNAEVTRAAGATSRSDLLARLARLRAAQPVPVPIPAPVPIPGPAGAPLTWETVPPGTLVRYHYRTSSSTGLGLSLRWPDGTGAIVNYRGVGQWTRPGYNWARFIDRPEDVTELRMVATGLDKEACDDIYRYAGGNQGPVEIVQYARSDARVAAPSVDLRTQGATLIARSRATGSGAQSVPTWTWASANALAARLLEPASAAEGRIRDAGAGGSLRTVDAQDYPGTRVVDGRIEWSLRLVTELRTIGREPGRTPRQRLRAARQVLDTAIWVKRDGDAPQTKWGGVWPETLPSIVGDLAEHLDEGAHVDYDIAARLAVVVGSLAAWDPGTGASIPTQRALRAWIQSVVAAALDRLPAAVLAGAGELLASLGYPEIGEALLTHGRSRPLRELLDQPARDLPLLGG